MLVDGWNTVLVLGGIRSGKSEYAESLVSATTPVRYLATAAPRTDDPEWTARIHAHRDRRSAHWSTEDVVDHPSRLAEVLRRAEAGETLLVDDLGGWVAVLLDPAHQPADDRSTIDELAAAVRTCAARLVLVSPEVGLALVPTTPVGRAFADMLGATNQAVAAACDTVVLAIAGQPVRIKPSGATEPTTAAAVVAAPGPTVDAPSGNGAIPQITPGMTLPPPGEESRSASLDRMTNLDLPGAGFGTLERVIAFAAGAQGVPVPTPWAEARVLLVHGDHRGGVAAGDDAGDSARQAERARSGQSALGRLAAAAGARLHVVDAPTAAPIEHGPALTADEVEAALAYGWRLAGQAAGDGATVLVIAACGAGAAGAAAAVLAATTGAEPAAVLGRVVTAGRQFDDPAWMIRCAAIRDALHRTRRASRGAKEVLAELGGGDIAVVTGILLGAAANRTPVLLDGPVGVVAGLVSRDLAGQAPRWCLLPDHGHQPTVRHAAEVLGLSPVLDLRLDLGEGATSLAALPLLRSALALAADLPEHPALATSGIPDTDTAPEVSEFVEPEPAGPGPATAGQR